MAEVGIFVGTMYGNSLLVAEEAQAILSGLGHQAKMSLKILRSKTGSHIPGNMRWW